MSEKTIEQLLEEQNALIRKQNELLERQNSEATSQRVIAERADRAARWDAANPINKYFFLNPNRR